MQGFGLASSPFAIDHCSMRFVSAADARSFVADVPAPVVCFFLASAPLVAKAPARSAACRGLCAAPYAGRAMRAAKFAQALLYESILAQECLFVGRLQQRGRACRPQ